MALLHYPSSCPSKNTERLKSSLPGSKSVSCLLCCPLTIRPPRGHRQQLLCHNLWQAREECPPLDKMVPLPPMKNINIIPFQASIQSRKEASVSFNAGSPWDKDTLLLALRILLQGDSGGLTPGLGRLVDLRCC